MLGVTLPTYHVSLKLGERMVGIVTPRNSVSKCPFDHTGFRALASTDRTPWTHVYYGRRGPHDLVGSNWKPTDQHVSGYCPTRFFSRFSLRDVGNWPDGSSMHIHPVHGGCLLTPGA